MKSVIYTILVGLLIVSTSFAQQDLGNGWSVFGQVRLRTELDGRDFSNSTHPYTFASSRVRFGLQKSFEDKVILYIQAQDSRVFGSEPGTLASSKNLDLHQGYVKLNKLFGWNWSIQAGRFEVIYGTERFFGAVGWHYVGRSFDGIRFIIGPKKLNLHLFALTVKESVGYIGNATPSTYPYPQEPTPSSSTYGFWKTTKFNDRNKLDVFGYYDVDRTKIAPDTLKLSRGTLGGSYWGTFGKISTVVEAGYQFGSRAGKDISAYLISVIGYYKEGISKLGIGADILSGTKPEDQATKSNTFETNYATNHKFYGFADYFINIPKNTMELGLHDFYLMAWFTPKNSKWVFGANFHQFMSNKSATISTDSDPTPHESSSFGQELDLTIKFAFVKGTTLVWGGSLFFPGDLMKYMFKPREDVAYWSYLMLTATL